MGSAAEALAFSQRITAHWMDSADEVVLSHSKFSDGADVLEIPPSPLIRLIPESSIDLPRYQSHRNLIVQAVHLEHVVDDRAPLMASMKWVAVLQLSRIMRPVHFGHGPGIAWLSTGGMRRISD